MDLLNIFLIFIIVVAGSFTIYYSFKVRTLRKDQKVNEMKFYNAKSNLNMGIMLISMAIIQLFIHPDSTTWRITVGLAFLALGGFNVYAGARNYRFYADELNKERK